MGELTPVAVLERPRVKPMTLEHLRGRLSTRGLQPGKSYEASLNRAQKVLRRQSGVAWLFQDVPVYALQDVHGDPGMLVRFLERKVPDGNKSITLFDALRQRKANAVLLGDVAHSQTPSHWLNGRNGPLQASGDELAATMNTQQMAFDLLSEFPGRFIWVRGNHDAQRQTQFGVNNDKNLAIAAAMQKEFGHDLHTTWIQTENLLPYLAANKFVLLSHAAPAAKVNITDVRTKQETIFERLTGTENRKDVTGSMSETEMKKNMTDIIKQISYLERKPHWIWVIGHRPTDNEPFRLQSNGRLLQINQKGGEIYAAIYPDGRVFVGDCRSSKKPTQVKRKFALAS